VEKLKEASAAATAVEFDVFQLSYCINTLTCAGVGRREHDVVQARKGIEVQQQGLPQVQSAAFHRCSLRRALRWRRQNAKAGGGF